METNFSTTITAIRTYDTEELSDIIKEVDWELTGINDGISFPVALTSKFSDPKPEEFIKFSEITPEKIMGWLNTDKTYTETKEYISEQIQNLLAKRTLVNKPLPW